MAKKKKASGIPKNAKAKKTEIPNKFPKLPDSKHDEYLKTLSPRFRDHVKEVLDQEDVILKHLSDAKSSKLLVSDPKAFFKQAKIKLSPAMQRRIDNFNLDETLDIKSFVLPNGQSIKPNININIIKD